jgi:putative phosphoesterase
VLDALARVAPVSAVAGNVDPVGGELPEERRVQVGRLSVLLVHGHLQAPPTPARLLSAYADARADIIVFGHTHRPLVERVAGVLVVNPGAAGPRRFKLRPSVAILAVEDDQAVVELVELPV